MKKIYLLYLFVAFELVAANVSSYKGVLEQDLGGSNWQFSLHGNATFYPASVPGTVHLDLLNNNLIEDPYYRDNVNQVQWIENKTWDYQTQFDVPADGLLEQDNIDLVFEGLDTHATVVLNGQTILKATNMFRTWVVPVKSFLKSTQNLLQITFHSAVQYDAVIVNSFDTINLSIPSDFDIGRIFTRKAAYHFGWDWGPRLVTSGIWRPVYLRGWNDARIDYVQFVQKSITSSLAQIDANLELELDKNGTYGIKVLNSETGDIYFNNNAVLSSSSGQATFTASFEIANPKLWWVRNFGDPYLYPLKIQILDGNDILDEQDLNLGIRTIELIQEDDNFGRSFYFKINGQRVFAKGGNYIPPDVFMPRVKREDYEAIIKDATDANYNFMRVWGGGNYEDDIFYEICDREGILLWQDMMFANGMYPAYDQALQTNYRQEIIDNVKRLRNHPSIALWCGNNEIKNGWEDWGYQNNKTQAQIDMIYGWYQTIFNELIPSVLHDIDTSRPYWSTSPLYGYGHNESYYYGDNHYYGVWVLNNTFVNYTLYVGRFMSEYGIQGLLCMNSIKKFTIPEDIDLNSNVIMAHEKGPGAYGHIDFYLGAYYKPISGFENYIYTTQIMQKLGIQNAIEAHRCAKPRNMGTLMWQLNDNWPSFSWSARDYYGTWKAVHYMAKNRFQDVIVAVTQKNDTMNKTHFGVQIVSEKLNDFQGTLNVAVKDLNGTALLSTNFAVQVPADSSAQYYEILYLQIPNLNLNKSFIEARLDYPFDEQYSSTLSYFVEPKYLELEQPNLTISVDVDLNTVTIQSDTLVMGTYLFIDSVDLHFDDNYFDLAPNKPKTVSLLNAEIKNIPDFASKLDVMHIYKTYSENTSSPIIRIASRRVRTFNERYAQKVLEV